MNQIMMEKKARSCMPKDATLISVERIEPRKIYTNVIQMFVAIYKWKGELYRTTLSGQASGRERNYK